MTAAKKGRRKHAYAQMLAWMREHKQLWASWPPPPMSLLPEGGQQPWSAASARSAEAVCRACVAGLKKDGLLASSTIWRDVSIGRYIKDLQKHEDEAKQPGARR